MTKVAKKELLLNKLVPLQHKGGSVTLTLTSDELATIVQVFQQPSRIQNKRATYLGTNTLRPARSKEMTRQDDDCYSVLEVAEIFQVTRQAVYKWIEEDKIKFFRRLPGSRDIRIPKDQFKKIEPKKNELLRRHQEIFGSGKVSLTNPKDVFRNNEVKDD